MDSPRRWTLPSAFFALQSVIGLAWWIWIVVDRDAAALFSVPGDASPTVYRFALPDVAVFVAGSGMVAVLGLRGSRWAAPGAWCVTGGVAYATLWCLGGVLWNGLHWIGVAAMAPAFVLDVAFALRLGGQTGGQSH